MKIPVISSFLLVCGLSSPLVAIERPKSLDAEETEDAPRAVEVEPKAVPRAVPAEERDPSPWLGVFSEPVDETLSSHLGIEDGIVLRFVAEDSPAAEAGLKQHDVVTEIDGKAVGSQNALRDAIHNCRPGDELKMSVVSDGKKVDKTVRLRERPAELPRVPRNRLEWPGAAREEDADRLPGMRRQLQELEKLFPDGAGDLHAQLEKEMRRMEKHLERMEKMPEMGIDDLEDMFEDLPKENNDFQFNLKTAGSMKLMDEEGSVEMKMRDGGKEVEVRDQEGNLLYEGPWDTEQDKAAVGPEMRERIERLNFDRKGGGLRFKMGHGHLNGDGGDLRLEFNRGQQEEKPDAGEKKDVAEDPDA